MTLPRLQAWTVLTMPGGAVLLVALAFFRPQSLPLWLRPLLDVFPALVFILGLLLGWSLDRARPVMAVLLLATAERAVEMVVLPHSTSQGTGGVVFGMVSIFLPLDLLVLAAIGDRGLLARAAYVPIGCLMTQAACVWWLSRPSQLDLAYALMNPLFDPTWSAWTPLPQPALLAFLVALALSLLQSAISPTVMNGSAVWMIVSVFVAVQSPAWGWGPSGFFAAAAVIVCWASVTAHYRSIYRDELTGIPGHRSLDRALANLGRRYAIAILDVDRLREVNDAYGEAMGDTVLRRVARVLAAATGGGKAFRYSGEEFAVLFPGGSSGEALIPMERLRKQIEGLEISSSSRVRAGRITSLKSPGPATTGSVSVTASIGIADSFDLPANTSDVIRAAYRAAATAKLDGGNRVVRASPEAPSGRRPRSLSRR